MNPEQIGFFAGLILTIMVFSYVIADNFLYRIAVYIFVGLAAGYITIVTVESVLIPWVRNVMLAGDVGSLVIGLVPLLFGLLLLLKSTRSPGLARLGNLGLALVIGVGTAVALIGTISGTLLPLVGETTQSVRTDIGNGFLIFIGVTSTLIYFQYQARRSAGDVVRRGLLVRVFGAVGQGFIVVTLGALYGTAIITSLTIFSERVAFIITGISGG